ncbi:MAG: hypothetical protein V7707_02545 [Motiliproteus sp.]
MQHDQTNLVRHVLSLYSGFVITKTNGEPLDQDNEYSTLNHRWISFDPSEHPAPPEADLYASLASSHWYATTP